MDIQTKPTRNGPKLELGDVSSGQVFYINEESRSPIILTDESDENDPELLIAVDLDDGFIRRIHREEVVALYAAAVVTLEE